MGSLATESRLEKRQRSSCCGQVPAILGFSCELHLLFAALPAFQGCLRYCVIIPQFKFFVISGDSVDFGVSSVRVGVVPAFVRIVPVIFGVVPVTFGVVSEVFLARQSALGSRTETL
jgi:hypothetical protein